jgi:anthranilate 1,2-dioxygenase large subunit
MGADSTMSWPGGKFAHVPMEIYHRGDLYALEQERIFRGPLWCFLGLEAEIPQPGDFRTTFIGDTPVLYNRGTDGAIYAMENRCAHRGAQVRRELFGNATEHECIYHRWCYDHRGELIGVPFQRGVGGKGGMSKCFDRADHHLRKLWVATLSGAIFASFSQDTPPLEDYLGEMITSHIRRTLHDEVRILGYQRQRIRANWKLYAENTRDLYHGSLLHEFQRTFGISRVTTTGGTKSDPRFLHNINYSILGSDNEETTASVYREANIPQDRLQLRDARMMKVRPEFADGYGTTICSLFPNATLQQLRNALAFRQLRTRGPEEFEIYFIVFGFASDDEEMTRHRLLQANFGGPGGYISLEDGEAIEITHRSTRRAKGQHSIIDMGGDVGLKEDLPYRVNDMPIRGFWGNYCRLMGIEAENAG